MTSFGTGSELTLWVDVLIKSSPDSLNTKHVSPDCCRHFPLTETGECTKGPSYLGCCFIQTPHGGLQVPPLL